MSDGAPKPPPAIETVQLPLAADGRNVDMVLMFVDSMHGGHK